MAVDDDLNCGPCRLRRWRRGDLSSLLLYANNEQVAANMRDRFPHPYTREDGAVWIELATSHVRETNWAIVVDDQAVGGIGLMPQEDINAGTAEIGYWLGETYWGRGIATAAVTVLSDHALSSRGYRRLFATVFTCNAASCRVLEKAGYEREGLMRRSAIKRGVVHDQFLYARISRAAASSCQAGE
jgi:RimJ/RimL family protein N-acetyltransferase